MSPVQLNKEEFARRGDAIYDREIHDAVEHDHTGEFAVIDIVTGQFEIDSNEVTASDRLLARLPDAQIWVRRVGSRFARHFGPRGI